MTNARWSICIVAVPLADAFAFCWIVDADLSPVDVAAPVPILLDVTPALDAITTGEVPAFTVAIEMLSPVLLNAIPMLSTVVVCELASLEVMIAACVTLVCVLLPVALALPDLTPAVLLPPALMGAAAEPAKLWPEFDFAAPMFTTSASWRISTLDVSLAFAWATWEIVVVLWVPVAPLVPVVTAEVDEAGFEPLTGGAGVALASEELPPLLATAVPVLPTVLVWSFVGTAGGVEGSLPEAGAGLFVVGAEELVAGGADESLGVGVALWVPDGAGVAVGSFGPGAPAGVGAVGCACGWLGGGVLDWLVLATGVAAGGVGAGVAVLPDV
jgi:hypothetical protein